VLARAGTDRRDQAGPRHLFDERRGTPLNVAVRVSVALASGRADALSGRHTCAGDDLDALIARAEDIRRDDLSVGQRRE
jgi:hypothetical protein